MPLESVAINNFENNRIDDPELKLRVEKLYDSSPEFATGRDAVAFFEKAFAKGDILYLGMFNEKPIAAMGCFNEGIESSRLLQYIVLHPANRGRGLAPKFVKQFNAVLPDLGIFRPLKILCSELGTRPKSPCAN